MTTKSNTCYSFSLSYGGKSPIIDTIIEKLKNWQENLWWEKVSYYVGEETFWVLWFIRVSSSVLNISITWPRHASLICRMLWMEFDNDKLEYQKDLFNLL